uniref:Voltage-dependent calcium channel alpha-2/delta subunit conserved region domain-containing protein n=1 Tax=Labrus bergylta TaxID=56723 RepID=A0A3Q3E712_9LABR
MGGWSPVLIWCLTSVHLPVFLPGRLNTLLNLFSSTGLFFGEVEGAVMNKLLQMGSFKRITLYDYQALCREYAGSSDSARTLSDVSMQKEPI